jgi:photosystem II stability/assembly factor-like uncharacterized protein
MFKEVLVICILLFSYVNSGWTPQYSGTTANLNDVFFPTDTLTGYICGDSGIILKTTNGGIQWTRQTTSVTTKLNAIFFIGDTGWSVGESSTALWTTDGGTNWSGSSSGGFNFYDVHFFNSAVGIVIGDNGYAIMTFDGGRTWDLILTGVTCALRDVFFINNYLGWIVGDSGTCIKLLMEAQLGCYYKYLYLHPLHLEVFIL